MPAPDMTVSVTNSRRRRTPPDGGYGIREKPRHDAWGTGEPVVHEDEWTVTASRRIGPSGTQPGGVEGRTTIGRRAVRAEPAAMGQADGIELVAMNHATGSCGSAEPYGVVRVQIPAALRSKLDQER